MSIILPWPPSINRYWRSVRGRNILSKEGRDYRVNGLDALKVQPFVMWAGNCRLSVTITVSPPDKRRRDLDNMPKAVLDLLTHGKVYADDSQIDRLLIVRGPVVKGGRVRVQIEPL